MQTRRANLPRIVGIGAQKAGTSWLHVNLSSHPDVWAPPFKELHFFDYKFCEDSKIWAPWHVRSNLKKILKFTAPGSEMFLYLKSLEADPILNGNWYKRVFSPMAQSQIGLDVTPEYCSLPTEGVEFLLKFLQIPKIIYIIRDPVERAISQIKMNIVRKKKHLEDPAVWEAMAREPVIKSRGDYLTYIPRWDRLIREVLYLPFGEITRNPLALLRCIEGHCGLASADYPNAVSRVFATPSVPVPEGVRSYLMDELRQQRMFLRDRFGVDFANSM